MTFGSRRLAQLFASAKNHGRYVRLFEEPGSRPVFGPPLLTYGTWFAMNFKVELVCDMKRSEIHSLGIHLTTGEIREQFYDYTLSKKLTPRLPENIHLTGEVITLSKATHSLEEYLQQKLMRYDHSWAKEANIRLQEELDRIHYYYNGLLLAAEMDKRSEISAQFAGRRQEIDWQYRPRIKVSVINCGLFHLRVFS
nr:YqhG family protein [Paenibacillus larvae]